MLNLQKQSDEKLGLYHKSGLSGSCPNLIDRIEGDDIDGKRIDIQMLQPRRQNKFIANSLLKPVANMHVDIIISSAEAEDIEETSSLDSISDMLPKYRQRSQSLDKLLTTDTSPVFIKSDSRIGRFRKETGEDCKNGEICSYQNVFALLENPESETRWYFKYFLGKVHMNYLGYDFEKSPFFLSVVGCGDNVHRCILWTKTGNKRMCLQNTQNGKVPTPKTILQKFNLRKSERSVKEVSSATLQQDFLTLEEQEGAVNLKFGVLYAHAGQQSDDEMFSNENGSQIYDQFLELLGETVELQGWGNYKGGLDTKSNATGTTSVYTVFEGHEVMFHVSTMLPYSKENRQQVERKRHIGNDIVVIIFVDGDDEEAYQTALNFNPMQITSHFNHIFALVTYSSSRDTYRVVLHSPESIPSFGPSLPPNGEFHDHFAFRDFLMAKLINAEKAAYCIPTFAHKRERTLRMLLKDVEQKCNSECRKSLSCQIAGTSPNATRKYKELEQSFSEVGQKIKVQKIIKGDHPTSSRTTAFKKDLWETSCIAENFPYKISCGDVCSDGTLIVSTPTEGTFMIFADGTYLLIIEKTLPVAQMTVAHRHKLLLIRSGFSKDMLNYFYAIPLNIFFSSALKICSKTSLESYRLTVSKGCHLFCTTPLSSNYLRVVIATKSKIIMLAWKHLADPSSSASNIPVTPNLGSYNPVDGFVKHREFTLADVPVMMDIIDEAPSGTLCIAYQKSLSVEAVDEITGDIQKIYTFDSAKTKVKEMQAVSNSGRNELLLAHNLTSKTISILNGMVYSNSPEIVWNAEPKHIAYFPPYILAFTADTIEIRIISNGSLIQSIDALDLKLISQKNDLVFSSRSKLTHSLGRADSLTRPEGKAAKVLGKIEKSENVHIYKISCNNIMGRQSSSRSLQSSSEKDEETSSSTSSSSRCSISDDSRTYSTIDTDHQNDPALEMRKLSEPFLDVKHPNMKPSRHMLVIPDTISTQRVLEIKYDGVLPLLNPDTPLVCPSPDSGVHDDFHSPPLSLKATRNRPIGKLHSTSSPAVLSESPSPCNTVFGNRN